MNDNLDDLDFTEDHAQFPVGHAGSAHRTNVRHNYSLSSSDSSFLPTPTASEYIAGQSRIYNGNAGHSLTISTHPSSLHDVRTGYHPVQAGPSSRRAAIFHDTAPLPHMIEGFHEHHPPSTNNVEWYPMNESQLASLDQQMQVAQQYINNGPNGFHPTQSPILTAQHSPAVGNDSAHYLSDFQQPRQSFDGTYPWSSTSQNHYMTAQRLEQIHSPEIPVRTIPTVIGHGQTSQASTAVALFSNFTPDAISRGENYTRHGDYQAETHSNLLEVDDHTHQSLITGQFNDLRPTECFQPQPLPTGSGTMTAATTPAATKGESFVLGDPNERFPNQPKLQSLARHIVQADWYLNPTGEPSLSSKDDLVISGELSKNDSWFNLFHDPGGHHRCRWFTEDGERCEHESRRKDRATGHARAHFGYKPFLCSGKCGKKGCQEGYTVPSFLKDHVNRKKRPTRPCEVCQKVLSSQNLKRHMDNVHQGRTGTAEASPKPEQSADNRKKKGGILNTVRKVLKKARIKSPSRNP